jgi:23S rRNA (cytidine1920-2'-O)/16S rRNA (cytidine1409-2'-O)-methyltransferase
MDKQPKERLDVLLVERGLAESRNQAQRLIRAGEVRIAGQVSDKPGARVATDIEIVGGGPDALRIGRDGRRGG